MKYEYAIVSLPNSEIIDMYHGVTWLYDNFMLN